MFVWKNQVLKRYRKNFLRSKPLVGYGTYKVLRGQWFTYWHCEVNCMIFIQVFFLKQEVLMVKNALAVIILNKNPKGLHITMYRIIPLKIRC
jgi:hypothetical protein